jgi:hypothetical protein
VSHNVTNIEGFESTNGMLYFASESLAPGFGGVVGTIAAGFEQTGAWALFAFGQGWQWLPLAYRASGTGWTFPTTFRSVMVRVYWQNVFAVPGPAQTIIALGDSSGPAMHTRVELDNLMELSVDGVKGPAPTVIVPRPPAGPNNYYLLEYFYDTFNGLKELRINGAVEYAAGGFGLSNVDLLQLGDERVGRAAGSIWDDVLIMADRVNPLPPMFPGAGAVHRLYATGVGALDDWNLGAGPNKTAAVSEIAVDGDATYITNPANPDRHQTFTLDPVSGIIIGGEDIKAIKVGTISRRVTGNPSWHHVALQSGATFDETIIDVWNGAYANRGSKVYEEDPDTGVDWTVAAADAIEAGLGIHNNHNGRCTNLYVQVDVGPPFGAIGRAKINPISLGPAGPMLINPPDVGS